MPTAVLEQTVNVAAAKSVADGQHDTAQRRKRQRGQKQDQNECNFPHSHHVADQR